MRVRAVKPFRWAGEHVEPGTLLDVDERNAKLLLNYGDVVIVAEAAEDAAPPVIRNADPVAEHRDPVEQKRRRR